MALRQLIYRKIYELLGVAQLPKLPPRQPWSSRNQKRGKPTEAKEDSATAADGDTGQYWRENVFSSQVEPQSPGPAFLSTSLSPEWWWDGDDLILF